MAWLQLYHRELASAKETFGRYLALYPAAPYAWLAAVRMGQAAMLQGHWAKAVSAFELAAGYTGEPLARVHARVLAGKAYEAAGEPAKGRDAYRASLASWTSDVPSHSWGGQKPVLKRKADEDGLMPDDSGRFTKADIVKRLAWLDAVLALPAGTDLARARWLLEQERYEEARALADRCLNATTKSSRTAGEARALSRRARLELALLQADVGREGSDHAKALRSLEILSRNTMDAPGLTARIAHACLLRKQGRGADAAQALTLALADWQRTQRQSPEIRRTLSALEQDVADIRALVFRPAGDREFKDTRWNGFAWPLSLPAFVVVAPEVEVVHADRTVETLSVHQLFVDLPNALFFDQEQITLLNTLMKRLGGSARMTPRNPMAVPNQPVGPSVDIRAFLSEAFPVIPGHWGGWHFDTFPTITRIEFHDAERSRAVARLVVGYGGADALLEKQDGKWRLVEVRRTWIT